MDDILGNVTIERLQRAVDFGCDESYISSLLDRYLISKMKELKTLDYTDLDEQFIFFDELKKALAIFGLRYNEKNCERGVMLNRSIPELRWYVYLYNKTDNTYRDKKWVIVTASGVKVEYEKCKKSNQRPFKDLAPDLQKKILDLKKKRSAPAEESNARYLETSPKILKMLEEKQNGS